MTSRAIIHADFDTINKNYPRFRTPSPIKTYFDAAQAETRKHNADKGLNPGDKGYEPIPTQCCFQVSQALNAIDGHKVPAHSYRRANAQIPGGNGYYLRAVDEMEQYLTERYGPAEDISGKGDAGARVKYLTEQNIKALICMRDGGYGLHTEFWEGTKIIQKDDPQGGMNQGAVMGTKRILVWEIAPALGKGTTPDWLRGWWQVYFDADILYYYFNGEAECFWTTLDPKQAPFPPHRSEENRGWVEAEKYAGGVKVTWPFWGVRETFSTIMNGQGDLDLTGWTSESQNIRIYARKLREPFLLGEHKY